jgi:hypothetical protein
MDYLLSPAGLVYNLPALLLLGILIWRRPFWGLFLAVLAAGRVFLGWIPWSMHMMVACFALLASRRRWMRGLAALLLLFTTYYYLWRFQDVWGWLLGGGMGILAASLARLSSLVREPMGNLQKQ